MTQENATKSLHCYWKTKPVLEEHPFDEEDFQEMLTETFKEFANEDEDLVVSRGLL